MRFFPFSPFLIPPGSRAPRSRFSLRQGARSANPDSFPLRVPFAGALAAAALAALSGCAGSPAPNGQEMSRILSRLGQGAAPPAGSRAPFAPGTSFRSPNGVNYTATRFDALPQWRASPVLGSLDSFVSGCAKLSARPQWAEPCKAAKRTARNEAAAKRFFESGFTPWTMRAQSDKGTVTGYYEPVMRGDLRAGPSCPAPIYGAPKDLVTVSVPAGLNRQGQARVDLTGPNKGAVRPNGRYAVNLAEFASGKGPIKGRIEGNRFVPYYTRAQIDAGALRGKAPVLGCAFDPVELFFMQIQGSGQMMTPSGRTVRLSFDGTNDHRFRSVANHMVRQGYLSMDKTSMRGIQSWARAHPDKIAGALAANPRYVFFKADASGPQGPVGALGVPLTAGYSGAVDNKYTPLGTPLYLATTDPRTGGALNRLIMAQDTGSAIKGPIRVDFYWGTGERAGAAASAMKYDGYMWALLPNGVRPG